MTDSDWWRGAVIYQIYPRSFRDSNNDGIGDLQGIKDNLPYVAALGVDAVWISPFFTSPMKDYGYDVADYCDVDPLFGTLDDFRELLDEAHRLGLKVIVDLVFSHTSNAHEWFLESRSSRDNPKSDWYVWADPQPDGSPPNNWQSFFGGPSWSFEIRRGQYYLHNFLPEQPDLNIRHPEVKKALLGVTKFWLDFGVDGFRFDAVMCFFHDEGLEDNPPNPDPVPSQFNIDFPTPHTMQVHIHDHLIEPGLEFAEEIRALMNKYEGRMSVAELGGEEGIQLAARYTASNKRFNTAYNFSLLSGDKPSSYFIRAALEEFDRQPGGSWPSWAFSNHDVVRVASRWHSSKGDYSHDPRLSRVLFAVLGSLRGTIFIYQGEELGLPEAQIPYEKIQDPWGKFLYPQWQGRDGCRTPMPWKAHEPYCGFGNSEPWLPIPYDQAAHAVDLQKDDKDSMLHFSRDFMQWRQGAKALVKGDLEFLNYADDDVLVFIRRVEGEAVLCLFNLAEQPKTVSFTGVIPKERLFDVGEQQNADFDDKGEITLPSYGILFSSL